VSPAGDGASMGPQLSERRIRLCSALALLLMLALVVVVCRDYGITWDEGAQSDYGRRILRWFRTLFRDDSAATHGDLIYYGGLFEVVAELAAGRTPGNRYETRHLVNALVGLLAVLGAQRIGTRIDGPLAGLLSGLFLALTPLFFGHLFNNPKDTPFAAFSTLALWAMLAAWDGLPRLPARRVAAVGLATGAALGVRAGGLVLLFHLFTLFAGWLLVRRPGGGGAPPARRALLLPLASSFASIAALAWAVMLLFWPWAQQSPLARPFQAMKVLLRSSGAAGGSMLFDGREVVVGDLPWSYVPVWFAVSLPESYAVALLAGLWLVTRALLRSPRRSPLSARTLQLLWLASVSGLPFLAAVVTRPFLYDGVRHLLFVVPPLAVLAGVAAARFLRSDLPAVARTAFGCLLAASALLTAVDMIRLHPYEAVYFNRLVAGGVSAASRRFETDYWGASYKEGVEWLVGNYGHDAGREVRVTCTYVARPCIHYLDASAPESRRFRYVSFEEDPDVVLSITRGRIHERFRGRVLHVVERMGAPLLFVVELRPPG